MGDLVDLLSFFLGLVNKIEPHYTQQARLLREHFARDGSEPHGTADSPDQ